MSFLRPASQQLRSRAGYTAARSFSRSALLLDVEKSQLEIKLRDGLKTAMKSKDKASLTCLKSVLADITNAAKSSPNPGDPLPESGVIASLRKSMQNRSAAAEQYAPGSSSPHPENYSNLQSEVNLIQSYLPEAPSTESIAASIREVIDSLTEEVRSGKGVQGAVMKTLWEKLGKAADVVDRKEIGKLVSEALKK